MFSPCIRKIENFGALGTKLSCACGLTFCHPVHSGNIFESLLTRFASKDFLVLEGRAASLPIMAKSQKAKPDAREVSIQSRSQEAGRAKPTMKRSRPRRDEEKEGEVEDELLGKVGSDEEFSEGDESDGVEVEDEDDDEDEEEEEEEGREKLPSTAAKKVSGPLSLKSVSSFKEKQDKSGVVYLSRVPPYMKPEKVKHLLGRHAAIGRVFLTPEDPAVRSKRKAMGGNKRQSYVDGWVEFLDKRDAKRVAADLNTQPVGGKATSFFSADLWNLRYLSKFKWHHLTEKIAYDNNVRRHKLQAEISQAKREKDFYLERVDQSKKISGKRRRVEASEGGDEKREVGAGDGLVLRTFRQAEPIKYLEEKQAGRGRHSTTTTFISYTSSPKP